MGIQFQEQSSYLKMSGAQIREAIRGSDAVVICIGGNPAASLDFIRETAGECAAQNVRLVYMSSWGSQYPWHLWPVAIVNTIAGGPFKYHLEKEHVLREISAKSGLDYTIVRPQNFNEDTKDGVSDPGALAVSQDGNPSGSISIPNVAYGIKSALERPELSGTTFYMWDAKDSKAAGGWSTLKPDSTREPLPSTSRHTVAQATYGAIGAGILVTGGYAAVKALF